MQLEVFKEVFSIKRWVAAARVSHVFSVLHFQGIHNHKHSSYRLMLPNGDRLIKRRELTPMITGINNKEVDISVLHIELTIIILPLTVSFLEFTNYMHMYVYDLIESHQLILWVNGHILFWERIKRYVLYVAVLILQI